ncbi:trehalose-phosphatase [Xylanimonas oleitrophica]|uniref:Trehalose 6-phosphate phosphatase n=1 Tax=Xylanimonas oleitrophica TaxID=2607479 RepID=A0A2W5WKN9_9MICO|nr:trehalose-phosphatase [Xylanimonas oleitrophica]PZR51622.1 trehalose-phosphatase [Xylanimonas oleitrophica]
MSEAVPVSAREVVGGDLAAALDALAAPAAPGTGGGLPAVLVALDFDGTLAPLVDDPTTSAMTAAARAGVDALAALPDDAATRLALVSGRALADLAALARPPAGAYLVGSHGAETGLVLPDGEVEAVPVELTPQQQDVLDRLVAGLEEVAAGVEGAWVQTKPAAAVLHTRRSPADAAARAVERADAVVAGLGLRALHGKDVVEVAVVEADKGSALARLRDVVGQELAAAAGAPPATVRVLYAGDDTTDEHALATLGPGDVGIKVGDGDTVARLRVADADAVGAVLTYLAGALRNRA